MRTLQEQLQKLQDWCCGLAPEQKPRPEDFDEGPLREGWRAVSGLRWNGDPESYRALCYDELRKAMMGFVPDGLRLFQRVQRVTPLSEDPFIALDELAKELAPVEWLWRGWLPASMLSVLAAKQGVGKSLLALDLARCVLTGAAWPDGTANEHAPANVIYVDGENIPQVHNGRACAWGLPREKLYLLLPQGEDVLVDLSTARYQEALVQMVFRLRPALVVVDALGAVLGKGENAVEDVRGVLGFLAGLAQMYETCVLVLHHLRKTPSGGATALEVLELDSIRGSGHITAMARVTAMLVQVQTGSKPVENPPLRLQVVKSNLAKRPKALGLRLEPLADGEWVRVAYDLDAPVGYERPVERSRAQQWLLDYLEEAGGSAAPGDVVSAAAQAGLCRAAIFKARRALQGEIVNTGGKRTTGNYWQLAQYTESTESTEYTEYTEYTESMLDECEESNDVDCVDTVDSVDSVYSVDSVVAG